MPFAAIGRATLADQLRYSPREFRRASIHKDDGCSLKACSDHGRGSSAPLRYRRPEFAMDHAQSNEQLSLKLPSGTIDAHVWQQAIITDTARACSVRRSS